VDQATEEVEMAAK